MGRPLRYFCPTCPYVYTIDRKVSDMSISSSPWALLLPAWTVASSWVPFKSSDL
jgi:hypothetical protein